MSRHLLLLTAFPLLLLGCNGEPDATEEPAADDGTAAEETAARDGSDADELADAAEVLEDRAVAGGEATTRLDFGDTAEHEQVRVTIRSARWGDEFTSGDTRYRDLLLDVRFENPTDQDVDGPLITAHCRGQDMYPNQHSGPIPPLEPLPAGTAADGEAIISVEQPCEDGWLAWRPDYLDDVEYRWPMPPA